MLAVMKGHEDVALHLIQKGANLDHGNYVSVQMLILYLEQCITENKKVEVSCFLKDSHYVLYKGLIVFKGV